MKFILFISGVFIGMGIMLFLISPWDYHTEVETIFAKEIREVCSNKPTTTPIVKQPECIYGGVITKVNPVDDKLRADLRVCQTELQGKINEVENLIINCRN